MYLIILILISQLLYCCTFSFFYSHNKSNKNIILFSPHKWSSHFHHSVSILLHLFVFLPSTLRQNTHMLNSHNIGTVQYYINDLVYSLSIPTKFSFIQSSLYSAIQISCHWNTPLSAFPLPHYKFQHPLLNTIRFSYSFPLQESNTTHSPLTFVNATHESFVLPTHQSELPCLFRSCFTLYWRCTIKPLQQRKITSSPSATQIWSNKKNRKVWIWVTIKWIIWFFLPCASHSLEILASHFEYSEQVAVNNYEGFSGVFW